MPKRIDYNISIGTSQKELASICPVNDSNQTMEVDRKASNRKRKTVEADGNISNQKLAR